MVLTIGNAPPSLPPNCRIVPEALFAVAKAPGEEIHVRLRKESDRIVIDDVR